MIQWEKIITASEKSHTMTTILMVLIAIVIGFVLIRLNNLFFLHLQARKKSLHLRFFESVIRVIIVIFLALWAFSSTQTGQQLYRMVFGSTVVLTGVIGLAAQNVLKDIFAGILLSIARPFDIGDRILFPAIEKASTVEDMTLRHVVLRSMDNIRYIIPNSEINGYVITNTSYKQRLRGTYIQIPIAYTADVRKAIEIARKVIIDCPYTFPNNPANEDLGGYGEVYVMSYDQNALNLETTIWTEPSMDNFLACSEIRMSILEAFRENDIEIPYDYVNIIMKNDEKIPLNTYSSTPSRNVMVKSDLVIISDFQEQLGECADKVDQYCDFHDINDEDRLKVQLLTEELLSFSASLLKKSETEFWIEGDQDRMKLNIRTSSEFHRKQQLALIKNTTDIPAIHQFLTTLKAAMTRNIQPDGWLFESQHIKGHDLEKQLLEAYSDDIRIGIIENHLMIIVTKLLNRDAAVNPEAK